MWLYRNGYTDVTVLEATNRTGGRIWTVSDTEGRTAEMGAYWIHGIEKNPIYQIADRNDLLQLRNQNKTLRHKRVFLCEDGTTVYGDIINKVDLAFGQCMVECEAFFKDDMPVPDDLESVGDYVDYDRLRHLQRTQREDRKQFGLVYDQRIAAECIINGCNSLHDVSLSDIGSYEELPGIHYTIPPGFERILDIVKQTIPPEAILLNHPVRTIHWGNQANNKGQSYPICVECENRKIFYADHVIVTVSLGVLKAACTRMFNPPLPVSKNLAIEHLGFGIVDKVILEFNEPITDSDMYRIHLLWDNEKFNKEISRGQDLRKNWVRGITSFEAVHTNVLLGWLCGNCALYMESLSEEEVARDCVEVLSKFLRKSNIPLPKKIIRTRWGNNPYTRGSYSFIHTSAHIDDIFTLQEPLLDEQEIPRVLFSGESTHERFYSTTHGAMLSGWREAERIDDLYRSTKTSSSDSSTHTSNTTSTKTAPAEM